MFDSRHMSELVKNAFNDLNKCKVRERAALSLIIAKDTGNVLVVRRLKDNQIGFPCGKIENDEEPIEGAYRELFEETGVSKGRLINGLGAIEYRVFEGTAVYSYIGSVTKQFPVKASKGFGNETTPFWMSITDLVNHESRFKSFNIVVLYNAWLID